MTRSREGKQVHKEALIGERTRRGFGNCDYTKLKNLEKKAPKGQTRL